MTTMTIRLDRLLTVAARLEAQPERFRFGWWTGLNSSKHTCGTVGCTMGHATEMFGKECGVHFDFWGAPTPDSHDEYYDVTDAARLIFGNGFDGFDRLFVPTQQSVYGVLDEDCTAAEAAAELRKYVAEKRSEVKP